MNARLCVDGRVSEKYVWESEIASGRKVYYGDSCPKSPCVAKFFTNSLYHIALRFWTFFLTLSRTAMIDTEEDWVLAEALASQLEHLV